MTAQLLKLPHCISENGYEMNQATMTAADDLLQQPVVPTFDLKEYRRALGSFPTGVAIITTRDADGEPAKGVSDVD